MAEFYRLENQTKHYDWGSHDLIPGLLGLPADGRPCAELWMGSHPDAPSQIRLPGGLVGLGEFIAGDAGRFLGGATAQRHGSLPYLFKLLAAEKPLSIQAHPNLEQAREGFARENGQGIARDAPSRNYRDPNHKPEIICALTPFIGMCGFRSPGEIARLFAVFLGENPPAVLREGFAPLLRTLEMRGADSALRGFLAVLFDLSRDARDALTEFVLSRECADKSGALDGADGSNGSDGCEWELLQSFARQHPGDPAITAPLYLNVCRLQPGEAVFLKAGELHAYVWGLGVELMANSDNVLRGGLTSKHVDVPELMKTLNFSPQKPQIMRPEPGASSFTYPAFCEEFSLAVMRGTGGPAPLATSGPSICILTEGTASVGGETLRQGESFFVPPAAAGEKPLELHGAFVLHIASVGDPARLK